MVQQIEFTYENFKIKYVVFGIMKTERSGT